ncbi:MAG: DNA recombination protein RmuC [Desulforegulaceae bacterium]|nr:DNA recombination protein RmuC [Desulforegulaceae bacterium]
MNSDLNIYCILTAVFGLIFGVTLVFFILKRRFSLKQNIFQNQYNELKFKYEYMGNEVNKSQEFISELTNKNSEKDNLYNALREKAVRLNEQVLIIPELKGKLESYSLQMEEIRQDLSKESSLRAKAEERNQYLDKLEIKLSEKEEKINLLNENLSQIKSNYSELSTRFEEQKKQNEQRLKDFEEAKHSMKFEFENLAGKILEDKSKKFTDLNKLNIGELIKPVKEQLGDFSKKVEQIHIEEIKDRTALGEQIKNLHTINQEMNKEARNLTRALTGDNKVQGNWGEMILEKILEKSGLRKGIEYETQGSFRDNNNNLFRPDVLVHLPDGKDIIIDSKVSLVSYNRYINSVDDKERSAALSAHILSVKNHINSLSQKDYQSLKGIRSLDFILMFMPIDAAFMSAFQNDESLFNLAFSKRIVIVTPTTLLATLRTIENIWKYERQNENAREIAQRAGKIYDKIRGFLEDFEKIGRNIITLQSTYEDARKKLVSGRGNLASQAEILKSYGVPIKKEISADICGRDSLEFLEN